jgi:hypothetical protein
VPRCARLSKEWRQCLLAGGAPVRGRCLGAIGSLQSLSCCLLESGARAESPDRQHTKVMSMGCGSRGSNRVGDNHSSGIDLRQVSLASDANRNDEITPQRPVAEARLQRKVDGSAVLMQLACKHDQNRTNANTVRTLSRYRCKLTDTRVCSFCKTCRNHDLVWRPEV